jgi:hypothetical protein
MISTSARLTTPSRAPLTRRKTREPLGFLASQKPNRLRVPKIPRVKSVTDSKWQNKSAKGNHLPARIGPDFSGPFTRTLRARALRPKPVPEPSEARRASSRVYFSFFLSPILVRAWRASNYLSWISSTSTSKVGLICCHAPLR